MQPHRRCAAPKMMTRLAEGKRNRGRDRRGPVDDMQRLSSRDKTRVGTRPGRDSRQESFEASVSHPFGTAGTETAAPPKMGRT